jgi:ribosomal protein L25 (general stress protein Ctc)
MSENRPSGEEQRKKMKEEFKKDLLARKEFLEKVRRLRQTQRINDALNNMSVDDDTDEWINKLNEETAFMDAKTELATEGRNAVINVPIEGPDGEINTSPVVPAEIDLGPSEAELQKIAAEEMVRQMKAEMAEEQGRTAIRTPRTTDSAPVSPKGKDAVNDAEEPSEDRPYRKMMNDINKNKE